MKKLIVLSVVLTFLVLTIAACGSENENVPAAEPAGKEEPAKEEKPAKPTYWSEQPVTLEMFLSSAANWPYNKDWPVWDWIHEKTNITIDGQPPSGKYGDAISLLMASGELPDLLQVWTGDGAKYGKAGAFLDLTKHLDQMPNLKKFWDENPDVKSMVTMPDGAVYMTIAEGVSYSNQKSWQYREDLFKKHSLQPPTNWEELYQVSKELKKIYPNSYPLVFRNGIRAFSDLAMSFGVSNAYMPDKDAKKTIFGPVTEEFKTMVGWLNKFYSEGLMPPDWLSIKTKQWTQNVATDQSFITVDYIGRIDYLNDNFEKGDGRNMTFMKPPAGAGSPGYVPNTFFNTDGLAVSATSNNKEAAFKYIDFLYSEEGIETLTWGKMDETYEVVNGNKKIKFSSFDELRTTTGIATFGSYGYFDPAASYSMMTEDIKKRYETVPLTAYPIKIITPTFTDAEQEVISVEYQAIRKAYEESISKFILGEIPLTDWEKYVSELNDRGLAKVIKIYEDGWKRQGVIK